jgi:hypothetical protein
MKKSCLMLFVWMLGSAGCDSPPGSAQNTEKDWAAGFSQNPTEQLKPGAEQLREAATLREEAARLIFASDEEANKQEALILVGKAARMGDPLAAVWQGRALLELPARRVEAAAWFLRAMETGDAASAREAEGEIEALDLSAQEKSAAKELIPQLLAPQVISK